MSVEELRVKRIGLTEHLKSINSREASDVFLNSVYRALQASSSAMPPIPPSAMPPIPPLVPSSSAMPPASSDMQIKIMKFLVENENTPEQAQFFDVISNIGIDRNVDMQDDVSQPPTDMDEEEGGGKHKQKRRRTIKRKYRQSIAV